MTFVAILLSSLAGLGCRSVGEVRKSESAPSELTSTAIDYVDTDGFDLVFESALVNHTGVITIRTPNDKPDWTGRLNGWIAAWNMGKNSDTRRFRGQIPVTNIDGDTLREFRLLVTAVVDRAEDASKASVQWWKEERVRQRRVELLRPYNLRFHVHTDGTIHLIFFNGEHARHYQQFLAKLTNCDDEEHWSRTIECSHCRKLRQVASLPETK